MSSHHRFSRSRYSRKQARKNLGPRAPAFPSWLILALIQRANFFREQPNDA